MSSPPIASLRVIAYSQWAGELEPASAFLARLPDYDYSSRLPPGADERLRSMARLDCDWHGECVRCFAELPAPAGLWKPRKQRCWFWTCPCRFRPRMAQPPRRFSAGPPCWL